jgi:poly(3-hydroxybutyrate) depolymerase
MLYHAYEMTHAAMAPLRSAARMGRVAMTNPLNPMRESYGSRTVSAALELLVGATRRYRKPDFGIRTTLVDGVETPVREEVVWSQPFCKLRRFRRDGVPERRDPRVLIVAPMSGHYATLLRNTVEAMLPEHDVYVTDWTDAREVPFAEGAFDLDDYADHLIGRRASGGDGGVPARRSGACRREPDGGRSGPGSAVRARAHGLADRPPMQPDATERIRH